MSLDCTVQLNPCCPVCCQLKKNTNYYLVHIFLPGVIALYAYFMLKNLGFMQVKRLDSQLVIKVCEQEKPKDLSNMTKID